MSLLLRFQGGFGVDSYSQDTIITVPQDVAEKSGRFENDFVVNVKVPLGSMNRFLHLTCDEAGNFLRDWYFDVASALAEWAEANYPLNWELAVTNCQFNYPLNWELGLASDLTDVELAEQVRLDELYDARLAALAQAEQARLVELYEAMRLDALAEEAHWSNSDAPTDYELDEADRLDELYDARLDELYDAHLADLFEEDQLVENQLARAKWAYPTNSELYEDDHLADMHEEVRLDALDEEAYWADELELYEEAHLAEMQLELAVKDHLLEMQLAEAKWAEETSAAEWAEEARIAGCSIEGAPYSWNYDMQ